MEVLYDAYLKDNFHQATFFHEYYHLIQARTTVCGIIRFLNNIERVIRLYDVINNKKEVNTPLSKWAENSPSDPALQDYLGQRSRFALEAHASDGYVELPLSEPADEFSVVKMDLAVAKHFELEGKLLRRHIVRNVNGRQWGIPILGKALSEAHAEIASCFFMGADSSLVTSFGSESEVDTCYYNSIPELIRRRLPKWPLHQTVFFLTDIGLMSARSDFAFCAALDFLENRAAQIPTDECGWNELRRKVEEQMPCFALGVERLEKNIKDEITELKRYGHNLTELFIDRLSHSLEMLNLRKENPMYFFPWESGDIDYIKTKFFSLIPVTQAKFIDTTRAMGVSEIPYTDAALQISMMCFSYLLDVFESQKYQPCPLKDRNELCKADREYACTMGPWRRGFIDEAGVELCPMSFIGKSLQIEEVEISSVE